MLALIEHPAQRRRLLDDPSLLSSAVEEILRWTSPVMYMARTAARDVELHGQTVRQGERLILWYLSANRDKAVFADPDRFDLGRAPNAHIAFGIGEHFCLGAGLARLELGVMFEELLPRRPRRTSPLHLHRRHQAHGGALRSRVAAAGKGRPPVARSDQNEQ